MEWRFKVAQRQRLAAGAIAAILCVIGLVYSEALQQQASAPKATPRAEVPGIAAISGPFSFAGSSVKTPLPRVVDVSAENLLITNASKDSAIGTRGFSQSERSDGAPGWLTAFGPAGPTRSSMLFFRSSLPTFSKPRSASGYTSLWASGAVHYLDTSFNSLMDSAFRRGDDPSLVPDLSRLRQELKNPFTTARQQAEAESAAPPAPAPQPAPPPAKPAPPPDSNANTTPPPAQQSPGGGGSPKPAAPEGPFLVVGDFDGNGSVEVRSASRIDDGTFAFQDAQRAFNLFVNPSAPELQRSFAIDDLNNDGIPDLLVTSRAALMGGVLLGDGQGNYATVDTFVTGYEPTVPVPGVRGGDFRDILTVNVRTGWVQTFRRTDSYRMVRGQAAVTFSPDFAARVIQTDSGADCLMTAQSGGAADVYKWQKDGMLVPSGVSLPQAPSVSINKDFLQDGTLGNLQIYQVGSSASVMVANSRGVSFNVANFRVYPKIFLIVGDISQHGTLDVAVAYLLSTTPTK